MYKKEFGKWGEQIAKEELLKKGLKFIASNFTFKNLEIDLIFADNKSNEIIFIEVKSRTSLLYGEPEDSIDRKKQINLKTASSVFISVNSEFKNYKKRFDMFSVLKTGTDIKIKHSENAF